MQQSSTFEITKAVKLRLTFREGAIQDSQEVQKGVIFVAFNDSTEALLLGKPDLDALGFLSEKYYLELRALGLYPKQ